MAPCCLSRPTQTFEYFASARSPTGEQLLRREDFFRCILPSTGIDEAQSLSKGEDEQRRLLRMLWGEGGESLSLFALADADG